MTVEERLKKLQAVDDVLIKEYGNGVIRSENEIIRIPRFSLSSPNLNYIFGGGIPKGRIIEFYGTESGGKTTLSTLIGADIQKRYGGYVLFVDAENSFDYEWSNKLGLNTKPEFFKLATADSGNDALDITEKYAASGVVDFIIVDSVAALVPKAEIEGEYGDSNMGLQARLMSQAMRKLTPICKKTGTTIVFINQIRCLDKNTIVYTSNGYKKIKDIEIGNSILYSDNTFTTVVGKYNSVQDGICIKPKYRSSITTSNNHIQPVIRDGILQNVNASDLKEKSDWLVSPVIDYNIKKEYVNISSVIEESKLLMANNSKEINIPKFIDEKFAFFLGCYYSDGSMVEDKRGNNWRIAFGEKNKNRNFLIQSVIKTIFGEEVLSVSNYNISINRTLLVEVMKKLGCNQYGKNKVIPQCILESSTDVIKTFIRGAFFDTHGYKKSGFIFTNENDEEIEMFSNILYSMGVFVDIRKSKKSTYLYITGNDAIKFRDSIGFSEIKKIEKAKEFIESNTARGKFDVVPFEYVNKLFESIKEYARNVSSLSYYASLKMCLHKRLNCSRIQLCKMIENIPELKDHYDFLMTNRFSFIEKIEKVKDNEFVDIQVDNKNETFIANMVLTHNCKIGVMFGNPECITPDTLIDIE
jgi:RecA/RadA recombinase